MPLQNFSVVLPGKVYRSAQPDAEGFASAHALGVEVVIKLNPESGSAAAETAAGFQVIAPAMTMLERFLNRPTREELTAIAEEIDQAVSEGRAVLVHCQHGRDWTGAACAAYRVYCQGWDPSDALAEFRRFGATGVIGLYDHEIAEVIRSLESKSS